MHIKRIRLINFRNYLNLDIELNKKINIFIGKNAQGKTNFLESIYLCAMGKSFRTSSDKELINFDKDESYVSSYVDIGNYERLIEVKWNTDSSMLPTNILVRASSDNNALINIISKGE